MKTRTNSLYPCKPLGFSRWLALLLSITLFGSLFYTTAVHANMVSGEQLFTERCSACHTLGQGKKLGPDLQGVLTRRDQEWLIRHIVEPESLLAEKDPIVLELVETYGLAMPPLGLNRTEAEQILSFFASTDLPPSMQTPAALWYTLAAAALAIVGLTLIGWRSGQKPV